MRETPDRLIGRVWRIFAGNIVLVLPPLAIGVINTVIYGFLTFLFLIACAREALQTGFNLTGYMAHPENEFISLLVNIGTYVAGFFAIIILYQFIIGAIHGAGRDYMYASAARNGKTGLADYFEGIAMFSGRMFMLTAVRVSLMWIPPLILLVAAGAFAVFSGGDYTESIRVFLIVIVSGSFFVFLMEIALFFSIWMWRPAMFTRDTGPVEALAECISFAWKRIGVLLVIAVLWFLVLFTVEVCFGIFNTAANYIAENPETFLEYLAFSTIIVMTVVRWTVYLMLRVYFTLFCFVYYRSETVAPVAENKSFGEYLAVPATYQPVEEVRDEGEPIDDLPEPWSPEDDKENDKKEDGEELPPGFC